MDFLISKEALYFYTSVGMVLRVKPNRALLKFKRNSHFFCLAFVEICVKGATHNSGPYVLPTSHLARTISFEPGILWKLLNSPVKSHMASNMNLSIRISTFPLFTIVKLYRDMEQWEIGCHRSSLWKSCWDMREGGHPQLGPLCLE